MPNSFSTDGAAGGWGGGGVTDRGAIPGVTMSDPGPGTLDRAPTPGGTTAPTAVPGADQWQSSGNNGYSQTGYGVEAGTRVNSSNSGFSGSSYTPGASDSGGGSGSTNSGAPFNSPIGFHFDTGGAVPDDTDGSNDQDLMAKALESVDKTLQYTYQKYGLGGGQQEAAAMPMIPGNQSETPGPYKPGQPQPQKVGAAMPMIPGNQSETPGPYKPGQPQPKVAAAMPTIPGNQSETPGPYKPGQPRPQKVSDADNDGDSDAAGAIDTDEGSA